MQLSVTVGGGTSFYTPSLRAAGTSICYSPRGNNVLEKTNHTSEGHTATIKERQEYEIQMRFRYTVQIKINGLDRSCIYNNPNNFSHRDKRGYR